MNYNRSSGIILALSIGTVLLGVCYILNWLVVSMSSLMSFSISAFFFSLSSFIFDFRFLNRNPKAIKRNILISKILNFLAALSLVIFPSIYETFLPGQDFSEVSNYITLIGVGFVIFSIWASDHSARNQPAIEQEVEHNNE